MMSRRNSPAMKALAFAGVFGFMIFGLYSYHKTNTELQRIRKTAEHLRQEHDSVSAQLQVVYEHKSQIDNQLQEEKKKHQQTREELTGQYKESEVKFMQEKEALQDRIDSINQQNKLLESRNEDLQSEYGKLQDELSRLSDDNRQVLEQHQQEFQLLKQENSNEIAQLKDEVANLERRNSELLMKVQQVQETNDINQQQQQVAQQQQLQQQQQQQQPLQYQQQQPLPNVQQQQQQQQLPVQQQQQQLPVQQQQQLPLQQQQQLPIQQQVPIQKRDLGQQQFQDPQQLQNLGQQQQMPDMGQQQQLPDMGQQQQQQQAGQLLKNKDEVGEQQMQINKPGDHDAYFKPKPAIDEGEGHAKVNGGDEHDPAQQVLPPQVDEDNAREVDDELNKAQLHHRSKRRMADQDDNLKAQMQAHQLQAPIQEEDEEEDEKGPIDPDNDEAVDQMLQKMQAFALDKLHNGQRMAARAKNDEDSAGRNQINQPHAPSRKIDVPDGNVHERARRTHSKAKGLKRLDQQTSTEGNGKKHIPNQNVAAENGKFLRSKQNQPARDDEDRRIFGNRLFGKEMFQQKNVENGNFRKQLDDLNPGGMKKKIAAPRGKDVGLGLGEKPLDKMAAPDKDDEDEDELAKNNKHYYDDADGQYQEDQEDDDDNNDNQDNDAAR